MFLSILIWNAELVSTQRRYQARMNSPAPSTDAAVRRIIFRDKRKDTKRKGALLTGGQMADEDINSQVCLPVRQRNTDHSRNYPTHRRLLNVIANARIVSASVDRIDSIILLLAPKMNHYRHDTSVATTTNTLS